ncbi:MAG: cation diffusion facilitator family transporter [Chitinivibrionales bacterium]|nr:cation diffusion facilitator family transporter [Chitinivibrionales bacterium]
MAGSVLLAGSLVVISRAIPRLMHPESPNAQGMLAFAVVGVLVNGAAILRLRGGQSMNARVVALHLLEDVLGWVAVLVVSVILLFKELPILDPVLSLIITAYVLYNAVVNLRRTLVIFLQSTPRDVDIPSIEAHIARIPGVSSVHHTHSWSLDGIHHVLTTHVVVPDATPWPELQRIKQEAKRQLRKLDFVSATIEVEHESEECEAEE